MTGTERIGTHAPEVGKGVTWDLQDVVAKTTGRDCVAKAARADGGNVQLGGTRVELNERGVDGRSVSVGMWLGRISSYRE